MLLSKASVGEPDRLNISLAGVQPDAILAGVQRLPGTSNYFIGNDESAWRRNMPHYARIEYREVYPGITWALYGREESLEYDFIIQPGASATSILMEYKGANRVALSANGDLVVTLPHGELIQSKPHAYQIVNSRRIEVASRFEIRGGNGVGFVTGKYDDRYPLVIDPVIQFSTYFGGTGRDTAYAVAVDATGNIYVAGSTASPNFPLLNAFQGTYSDNICHPTGTPTTAACPDAFISKFDSSGTTLLYSTYLGGAEWDEAFGIAADPAGNAYVTGTTKSTNFPTANAYQNTYAGGRSDMPVGDVFVAKLNSGGSQLTYSTYLGGAGSDAGFAIALDSSGNAYITGEATQGPPHFPVLNAIQSTPGGSLDDAILVKLNSMGTVVYSTFIGGNGREIGRGIAVDSGGAAYITGWTSSTDFPGTSGGYQMTNAGGNDVFAAKINPQGSAIVYSTYLGGTNNDQGNSIAVDGSGNAFVTGSTNSSDFPTRNAFQSAFGGGDCGLPCTDVFVTRLNPFGTFLAFSTYLGGNSADVGYGIALDASDNCYVTGITQSTNFPLTNSVQAQRSGPSDAFISKLTASLPVALAFSTYFGGTADDEGRGVRIAPSGNAAVVAGWTGSADLHTTNAYQMTFGGGDRDAFLLELSAPHYTFGGFLPPLVPGGEYQSGRTLPVGFQLRDSSGNFITEAVASLQLFLVSGSNLTPAPVQSSGGGTSDTEFRVAGHTYLFNLSTRGLEPGPYLIRVLLDDGSLQETQFQLRS